MRLHFINKAEIALKWKAAAMFGLRNKNIHDFFFPIATTFLKYDWSKSTEKQWRKTGSICELQNMELVHLWSKN